MATFDGHKNFAYATVSTPPSPATSGTTLILGAGQGSRMPTPPFNALSCPSGVQPLASNSEIIRVTAISVDTLTIVRAQEGTTARAIVTSDQLSANITAKMFTDIESVLNTVTSLPTVISGGNLGSTYTLALAGAKETWLTGTLTANLTITVTGLTAGAKIRINLTQPASWTLSIDDGSGAVSVPIPITATSGIVIIGSSPNGTDLYVASLGTVGASVSGVSAASEPVAVEDYIANTADVPSAIQAAITAATASGTVPGVIKFKPGKTYDYGTATTIPAFPRNVACTVEGRGATIKLSATAPRAFDFAKIANFDYFKNIVINDLIVDVNHVGGKHHALIGTYQNGTPQSNISVTGMRVRRCKVINADSCSSLNDYSVATNHRLCIHIAPTNHTTGELTDIAIEDCRFEGGNEGVFVGVGGAPDTATTMDDVHIRRCWHSTLAAPTAFFPSANFQLGSYALGGSWTIEGCTGLYSGDVGIEIDNFSSCTVTDTNIEDAYDYNFYFTNFSIPTDATGQSVVFTRCRSRKALVPTCVGWQFSNSNAITATLGNITLRECRHYSTSSDFARQGDAIRSIAADIDVLTLDDFKSDQPNAVHPSGTANPKAISLTNAQTLTTNRLIFRNVRVNATVNAAVTTLGWNAIQLVGQAFVLDWDVIRAKFVNTGTLLNHTCIFLNLGPATSTTLTGVIRRFQPFSSGDQGTYGIQVGDTNTTIVNDRLVIEHADFTNLGTGGSVFELNFAVGGTGANKVKVYMVSPRMRVAYPSVPVALTPSASPYAYQNLDNRYEYIRVLGGTVSKIEVSPLGSPSYYDIGVTQGRFLLEPGDLIRTTYSVVPTMDKSFAK
jgi:hypothetical protein